RAAKRFSIAARVSPPSGQAGNPVLATELRAMARNSVAKTSGVVTRWRAGSAREHPVAGGLEPFGGRVDPLVAAVRLNTDPDVEALVAEVGGECVHPGRRRVPLPRHDQHQ